MCEREPVENRISNLGKGCRDTVNGSIRCVPNLGLSQYEGKIEDQLILVCET